MNFKKWILMFVLVLFSFTFIACDKDNENDDDEEEPTFTAIAITDVLKEKKNNDEVQVKGVVYAVISNGFYVADSAEGRVFVIMGSAWDKNVNVGDEVEIDGKFSYISNFPQIKNPTVSVVSSDNTSEITKENATVQSINQLSYTAKEGSYGKLVTLTATVTENSFNFLTLMDDEGNRVLVDENSNISYLRDKLNKRITLDVIVHKYSSTEYKWIVSYASDASGITESPLTFADLKAKALAHIAEVIPSDVYGALTLPEAHPILSYITYSWAIDANDYVSIQEGKAVFNLDSVDHALKLKLTITANGESETVEIDFVSKGIVERSVDDLLENTPEVNMSVVIVRGVVVGIARNQSLSLRSYIIQDPTTKATTTVDFTNSGDFIQNDSQEFKNVQTGDEIVVTGQFRTSDRPTIMNVSSLVIASSDNTYSHDTENAFELKDEASYLEFGENYRDYLNKLVKITDPFINYSTSSTPSDTNWVRLGYSSTTANTPKGIATDQHVFAFLIACQNESLGSDIWHKMFDVPLINDGAKQFGLEIYAYPIYVSDTYLAFLIPDWDCFDASDLDMLRVELGENIPASIEEGNLTLPTTSSYLADGATIAWSSSHPEVISAAGVVSEVTENVLVTLTATFTYQEVEYSYNYQITVMVSTPLTVSEVLDIEADGQYVKVKGVIAGYISDGNSVDSRKGILLIDNATGKLVLVNGLSNIGGTYGAYIDSLGNALSVGDEIVVSGTYYLNSVAIGSGPEQTGRNNIDVALNGKVKKVGTATELNFDTENAIVINNDAGMEALANDWKFGQLIKLVGTKDAPLFVGGSSSSNPFNIKLFFNGEATENAHTKYNGRTFSLKSDVNEANAGSEWYKNILDIDGPFVGPNTTTAPIAYFGEVYVVLTYITSTYQQMSIVNVDECTIAKILTTDEIKEYVVKDLPASVESGDLTFTLPTTNKYVDDTITWSSSNSAVLDLETMKALNVTENSTVTITASYKVDGVVYTSNFEIVVVPPIVTPLTVSEVLDIDVDGQPVLVKGVIAAYISDGNTTESRKGVLLMDNESGKMVLVNGLSNIGGTYGAYLDSDGVALALKDEVVISGTYYLNSVAIGTGPEQTGRNNIDLAATDSIRKVSTVDTLNFNTTDAITISDDAGMQALADSWKFGQLIKLVGTSEAPLYMGGSSSKLPFNIKLFFNGNATVNDDTKYNGRIFSLKSGDNEANAGSEWYKTLLGIDGPFVGPSTTVAPIAYTGEVYVVLGYVTSTYQQMSIVNVEGCTLQKVQ